MSLHRVENAHRAVGGVKRLVDVAVDLGGNTMPLRLMVTSSIGFIARPSGGHQSQSTTGTGAPVSEGLAGQAKVSRSRAALQS
jgi:hypothetical protein